jgi:4a-hydroxytetrahydrobiopterin dehydratase
MKLSDEERVAALGALPGWAFDEEGGGAIARTFRFRDFGQAFGFMAQVALAAEKADHHPDWSNSWNRVDIRLSTHSEGGVTGKDMVLARSIDAVAAQLALPETAD